MSIGKATGEMEEAMGRLASDDMTLRKKGLRRLSGRSRMSLMSPSSDEVGAWFMENGERLFQAIRTEWDADIQAELVFSVTVAEPHAV